MLKEAVIIFLALFVVSFAYPAEEAEDPKKSQALVADVPVEQEELEGAESANPQWGWGRGYYGRGGYGRYGGYGYGGYGGYGGYRGHRGYGWGHRGYGWGR